MNIAATALFVTVLSYLCGDTYSLSCLVCDSDKHADCNEFYDHANNPLQAEDCTVDSAEFCIKTTGVWGGVVGTTRFCSSRDLGNQCQFIRYPDHDRVYRACVFTCRGNSCNGASGLITLSHKLLMLLVVSVLSLLRL